MVVCRPRCCLVPQQGGWLPRRCCRSVLRKVPPLGHVEGQVRRRGCQRAPRCRQSEVPVVEIQADDLKSLEFSIVENVQRRDLNPIEEAQGYKKLIDDFNYDQEKVSKFIGKSRVHVTNCLRLLTLPDEVISLIEENKISQGHAKVLVGLDNAHFLAKKMIEKNYQ